MFAKRFWGLCTAVLLAAALAAGCGDSKQNSPAASAPVELNVSAATSMKDVLTEIQQNYQQVKPNVKINFNFGASGSLQKQIEQGAPADIFISAAAKQMDELAGKNLIDLQSRQNLVENQLVMVVPKGSPLALQKFADVNNDTVKKFAMGEPEVVPAGQYAQQVLRKLNLWENVKSKAVFAKDVRTVLTYVETGNVDAGFVYRTDAVISNKVQIAAAAPADSHKPIVYPAAILAGAQQTSAAQDFMAYLQNPEVKAIFEKYGFVPSK